MKTIGITLFILFTTSVMAKTELFCSKSWSKAVDSSVSTQEINKKIERLEATDKTVEIQSVSIAKSASRYGAGEKICVVLKY